MWYLVVVYYTYLNFFFFLVQENVFYQISVLSFKDDFIDLLLSETLIRE